MYDGYQVLRFENNYKSKDLYLIGNEMNNRVGTGNYDKERTKFNIKYKELEKDNLYQDVKYKLESRNIEYLHKTKTNLLNGVTISSGPEFFMTLGLPFKETDRKYKTGKKEGQNIWTPDIKSKDDIPEEVNIVIAQVHFDEDTPHLQAYFLPVVNEVKRKCYQRDKDGNLIKEIKKDRNGKDKEFYPKPDGHNRFYTYYTKYNKELCSVTVAVRNKYKKWYCKQVIVHGIHSDKVWLQDIGITMGFYVVGWYREKLTSYPKWYDYNWGYNDDKYFNKYAPVINKEFILSQPEYKYSAIEQYEYTDTMKYLRLYEQYPQTELLVKCGLSGLATRQTILKKCKKDKNFCKWLYKNKENLKNNYCYTNAILKAYSQNRNIKEVNRLEELKYALRSKDNYRHLKEVFAKDLTKLVEYLVKQDISIPVYEDYLQACEYLGLDMNIDKNRFPKQFMRWHNIRIDEYHTKQAEEDAKIRKELYEKFASVSKKYTNLQRNLKENYICIIAKSPKDLIIEGFNFNFEINVFIYSS